MGLFSQTELLTSRRAKGKVFLMPSIIHKLTVTFRQANADYAFTCVIARAIAAGVIDVVFTYDIVCQWEKFLARRLASYLFAPSVSLKSLNSFRTAVPKFHIIGHGASCQANFNLAYMDGVGMTHGEGVETIWSHSGSLAVYTRENGPNARHLILDDHWNGWNWQKYTGLRKRPDPGVLAID